MICTHCHYCSYAVLFSFKLMFDDKPTNEYISRLFKTIAWIAKDTLGLWADGYDTRRSRCICISMQIRREGVRGACRFNSSGMCFLWRHGWTRPRILVWANTRWHSTLQKKARAFPVTSNYTINMFTITVSFLACLLSNWNKRLELPPLRVLHNYLMWLM